jgi:hypothetical protein
VYFRPSALPVNIKEAILKKFNYSDDLKFLIALEHAAKDDEDFNKMLDVTVKQDLVKGIAIKDYLPEFYALINSTV